MTTIVRTPHQNLVEDFIKTAEANGHRGWALLPQRHPKVWGGGWSQIRTLKGGVLAFYHDELGNRVELRSTNGRSPQVFQVDPRRTFYCRCYGATSGRAIKATNRAEARRIFATKELLHENSASIVISTKPTLGLSYYHNA